MSQVVSKKRVADHGEVYTAKREVDAMLDLVKYETERADSRFLEPACGTGNFLAPILERKLAVIKNKYAKSQLEFERYAIIAIGSIYGVDILEDNIRSCRDRLFIIFNDIYTALYKEKCKAQCRGAIEFILSRNILWGDALSLMTVGGQSAPIIFSQWSFAGGSNIKRRDYAFPELVSRSNRNANLFDECVSDDGGLVLMPKPIKDYPLKHFLNITDENAN